jgi:hypothetical protein
MKIIRKVKILIVLILLTIMIPLSLSRHKVSKFKKSSYSRTINPKKDPCYKPGFLRRALSMVKETAKSAVKLVYDPEYWRQYRAAIQSVTIDNINQKNELLKTIMSQHPNLTDSQIIRINYYLGTKTYEEISSNTEQIKNNVNNFLQRTLDNSEDEEYVRAVQKILTTNQSEMSKMILEMDYLDYSIYADIQERMHTYFLQNELHLFEPNRNFRFSELGRRVHKRKKHEIPDFVKDESQFLLDSFKKNLDYINSNAKNTLSNINTVKNTIKNTEIFMNLSKAVIEIDKIPVLEDITNKIKSEVAVV